MAEPKKRLTSTRSGNRRSHLAIKKLKLAKCSKCQEPKPSHQVCPNCGTYNNKKILELNIDKKLKKGQDGK